MISYKVNREQICLLARAEGVMSQECLQAHWRAARSASEIGELDALYDFRDVDNVTFSAGLLRDLAQEIPIEPNERKVALVAETNVVYGMSRMFQTLTEEKLPNLRIFRGIEPALEYLGLH